MIDRNRFMNILKNKSMTISKVAHLLGVDRPRVSEWVNGRVAPSLASAHRMAKVMECRVDDFLVQ